MTLNVSTIGDNPQQPGIYAETYVPDQLIAGNLKLVTQPIVLAAGTLQRGTVLGQQTTSSVEVTAGTNTGNGTVTLTSLGATPTYGPFVLTAKTATDFGVVDPEGNVLADATVGTAYAGSPEINFKINAGGTAFVAGDSFTLLVVNATGNYIESVKTASDGSQNPVGILVDYADASGGPVTTDIYVLGEFNQNAITFDPSWTLPLLRAALQPLGIFLKNSVSAADPS